MTVNMIQIIDTMLVNSGELNASAVCSEQEREAFEAVLTQVLGQFVEEEPYPEPQPATQQADEAHEEAETEPSKKAKPKGHKVNTDAAFQCVTACPNTIVAWDQPVKSSSEQAPPLKARFEAQSGRETQKRSAMVATAGSVDPSDSADPSDAMDSAAATEPAQPVDTGGTRGMAETPKPEPEPEFEPGKVEAPGVRGNTKPAQGMHTPVQVEREVVDQADAVDSAAATEPAQPVETGGTRGKAQTAKPEPGPKPGKVEAPQIRGNAKTAWGVYTPVQVEREVVDAVQPPAFNIPAANMSAISRPVVNKHTLKAQVVVSRTVTAVAGKHPVMAASPAPRADAVGLPATGLGVSANRFTLDEVAGNEPGITPGSLHAVEEPGAVRVRTPQQSGPVPMPIRSGIGFSGTDREEAAQLPLSIEKPTVLHTAIGKMVMERARVMHVELEYPDHKAMERAAQTAKTAEAPMMAEPKELVERETQPRVSTSTATVFPIVTPKAATVSDVEMKPYQEQVEVAGRAQVTGPEKASRQVIQELPKNRMGHPMQLSIAREQMLQPQREEEDVKVTHGDEHEPKLRVSEPDTSEPMRMASDSEIKAPKPRQPHTDAVPYARTKPVTSEEPVARPMKTEAIDEPRAETARTQKSEPISEPSQPVAVLHAMAEAPAKAEVQRPDALQISQTNRSELIEQAERAMASAVESGGGTIRVKLHPESLGGLEIRVKVVGKSCTATIKAERPEVGKFIEANSSELAVSLFEKGLDLAGLAVSTWDQARGGWNGWNGHPAGGQEWQWQGHQEQRNEWGSGGEYQGSSQQHASDRHGQSWGNGSGREYPHHERPRTWQAYIDYLA